MFPSFCRYFPKHSTSRSHQPESQIKPHPLRFRAGLEVWSILRSKDLSRINFEPFWAWFPRYPHIILYIIYILYYSIYYMHIYNTLYIYISKKTVKSQQWGRYSARNMWLTRRPRTKTWPGCCLSRNCCCCSCCLGRFATMRLTNLFVHVAPEIHENDL
jgi:hypothetical protein